MFIRLTYRRGGQTKTNPAQSLQIDPNFATAWYRKGWTLQKLGKHDEAKQYIHKARGLGYEG